MLALAGPSLASSAVPHRNALSGNLPSLHGKEDSGFYYNHLLSLVADAAEAADGLLSRPNRHLLSRAWRELFDPPLDDYNGAQLHQLLGYTARHRFRP